MRIHLKINFDLLFSVGFPGVALLKSTTTVDQRRPLRGHKYLCVFIYRINIYVQVSCVFATMTTRDPVVCTILFNTVLCTMQNQRLKRKKVVFFEENGFMHNFSIWLICSFRTF